MPRCHRKIVAGVTISPSRPGAWPAASRRAGPATREADRARPPRADDAASGSRRPSATPPAATGPAPTRPGSRRGNQLQARKPKIIPPPEGPGPARPTLERGSRRRDLQNTCPAHAGFRHPQVGQRADHKSPRGHHRGCDDRDRPPTAPFRPYGPHRAAVPVPRAETRTADLPRPRPHRQHARQPRCPAGPCPPAS